jgi:glucokinase
MLHLAGDVGGTNTRLALFSEEEGKSLSLQRLEVFPSRQYDRLSDIVVKFLGDMKGKVVDACIGVPGPVRNGEVRTTNLPWHMSEGELSEALELRRVRLINDLGAVAAALSHLPSTEIVVLHGPVPPQGATVRAVIAPGTGLGQAAVLSFDGRECPLSSEGGHVNFAPTTQLEFELVEFLLRKLKITRVSVERLLSGPGIVNIYTFLRDTARYQESAELAEKLKESPEDRARLITDGAVKEDDELCRETIDLFAEILGRHAGNVMLTYDSTGGVYIGGGIVAKILPRLLERRDIIVEGYTTKGRLSPIIEATPLMVITNDKAGLLGAAHLAAQL